MQTKKITLVGYYGYDNLGDDIMLDCILKEIANQIPNIKVEIICKNSENLSSILSKYEYVNHIEFKSKNKFQNFKIYIKSIRNSDITIWGGGTCFSDEDGIGNFKYFIFNILLNKPFAYLGIGIGNLNKVRSKIKTKILFKTMLFATIRDNTSYKFAKRKYIQKNIFLTSDLSYLFKISNKRIEKPYILISFRDLRNFYSSSEIEKRHTNILNFVSEIAIKENLQVLFLPIDSVKDSAINERNSIYFSNNYSIKSEYILDNKLNSKINYIQNAKYNFSERLHSLVISKFCHLNCVGLSYSPKIDRFFEEIDSKSYIPYDKEMNQKEIEKAFSYVPEISNLEEIEKKTKTAKQNISYLKKFIYAEET
ncbi:polysaccharide pyruvyl transferase family protein [Cellulophaga baltica]|uniref:Polysaccharide pyruvyl transferase family protein WcaK n=1 Tax=Cellulophaga baltica TaxID=76594 RepID=A0A1G7FQ56_9FLAO|nr:polysaccharide pyruvyl transferase family protein [Cellulophaga baltica]SDE77899.1 Polysaccharide pyruvyl transferase family protein WcaK [Cellulophaga baltica]